MAVEGSRRCSTADASTGTGVQRASWQSVQSGGWEHNRKRLVAAFKHRHMGPPSNLLRGIVDETDGVHSLR